MGRSQSWIRRTLICQATQFTFYIVVNRKPLKIYKVGGRKIKFRQENDFLIMVGKNRLTKEKAWKQEE